MGLSRHVHGGGVPGFCDRRSFAVTGGWAAPSAVSARRWFGPVEGPCVWGSRTSSSTVPAPQRSAALLPSLRSPCPALGSPAPACAVFVHPPARGRLRAWAPPAMRRRAGLAVVCWRSLAGSPHPGAALALLNPGRSPRRSRVATGPADGGPAAPAPGINPADRCAGASPRA